MPVAEALSKALRMSNPLYDALIGDKSESQSPFVTTPDGETLSYHQFASRAGQVAHALLQLGVRPGDRVMVQAEKSIDVLALYLGTLRAGAVFVPLNTTYTAHEVEYFVSDAEPLVFICTPQTEESLRPVVESKGAKLHTLDDQGGGSWLEFCGNTCSAVFSSERSGSDLAAILYTSGTTGRSKGAMLTHDNLLCNANSLKNAWHFTAQDVLLHTLPIYHSHGLFVAINTTMLAGASMIFMQKFSAEEVAKKLKHATVLMGVPTHYIRLLNEPDFALTPVDHMRLFTSGSAPLLAETHESFTALTGYSILERYGLTETNMNTSNPYDTERRPGTVGHALPDIKVEVRDPETGATLPQGETGSIEVNGPNVFAGYWRNPEKTYEEFRADGFFITGDLGFFDKDGYLTIVGRSKDLVITGGFNVYPKEVEVEIDALPEVLESAVVGLPHLDFGEGVTAIVVIQPGKNITPEKIFETLGDRLAKFKQPKKIIFVDHLPRNAMGKVQKNLLRETHQDLYQE